MTNLVSRKPSQVPQLTSLLHFLPSFSQVCTFFLLSFSAVTLFISLASTYVAVLLFLTSVLTSFVALTCIYISLFVFPDVTLLPLPTIYHPDNSTTSPPPITYHSHDLHHAILLTAEIISFASGAIGLYVWTSLRPVLSVFVIFQTLRLLQNPLFLIHVCRYPRHYHPRPFGATSLFSTVHVQSIPHRAALRAALNANYLIVACSATWCPTSRAFVPVFENLAQNFPRINFAYVDVDISHDIVSDLAITTVPTFHIFHVGQPVCVLASPTPTALRTSILLHCQ